MAPAPDKGVQLHRTGVPPLTPGQALKERDVNEQPTRCSHPKCGVWTWKEFCSDACAGVEPPQLDRAARGIGLVTLPRTVHYRRPRRVRPNDFYIASNGARIPTATAGYSELRSDLADLERRFPNAETRPD